MREINGISIDPALIEEQYNSYDNEYAPPMDPEYVTIAVGNDGQIERFLYDNMMEAGEELSEGALLKDFDSILSNGIDQVKFKYSFNNAIEGKAFVNIDSIELEMKYVRAKDELENALLVPVWKFGGTICYDVNGTRTEEMPVSVFVDAVDGSSR